MVRSPWKLLTVFLSRGSNSDERDAGQNESAEILDEAELLAPNANSPASEASIGVASPAEAEPSAALRAEATSDSGRQDLPPLTTANVRAALSAGEGRTLAPKRTRGAKRRDLQGDPSSSAQRKNKVQAPVHKGDLARAVSLAKQTTPSEPDAFRVLDHEIQELRSQLGVKLRLQNDQLKQMLDRFGSG